MLFQQQFTELFARGHDGARSGGRLLHRILLVSRFAHERFRLCRLGFGQGTPGRNFLAHDTDLRSPVVVAGVMQLVLEFLQISNFAA